MASDGGEPPDDTGQERAIVENIEHLLTEAETVTEEKSSGSYAEVAGAAMTTPWGVDGKKCEERSYEKIIEDSKTAAANVLTIVIQKLNGTDYNQRLNNEDIENIIFDEIRLKVDDIEEIDFSRYNVKEIYFKDGIDFKEYLRAPFFYKGHVITLGDEVFIDNRTRITFKNVPKYIPDEELINFCRHYGTVKNATVYYGKHQKGRLAGLPDGSRWLEMEIPTGDRFINYLWLEGPNRNSSDRITITYSRGGSFRQCGHCLKTSMEGCPGGGKAKICREKQMNNRASAESYMKRLETEDGFKTLKAQHLEKLKEKDAPPSDDTEKKETESPSDDTEKKETESPEEKDNENTENINLKKEINSLKAQVKSQNNKLEKSEGKMKSVRKMVIKNLQESLQDPLFERQNMSFLVMQLGLTITEEEYDANATGKVSLMKEKILKELDLSKDENGEAMKNFNEFIKELENQMHVKFSTNGERRLSIGGKRKPSEDSNLESVSKRAPDSKLVQPSRRKNRTPTKTLDIHVFNKS